MTPKRKAALQWFHDRGEIGWFRLSDNPPSDKMVKMMVANGQLQTRNQGDWKPILYSLTDKGRRMLNGDAA